jgi:DNA-binding transcriptional ArsR family regulator
MPERGKEDASRQLHALMKVKVEKKSEGSEAAFRQKPSFNLDLQSRTPAYPESGTNGKIDSIEVDIKTDAVCSNINRVSILHLLKKCPGNEMQAEKIAQSIGVSHRTALYHLDILEDYNLVEVRGFRKKGQKMLRSVWGLNMENGHAEKVFMRVARKFPLQQASRPANGNGYAR